MSAGLSKYREFYFEQHDMIDQGLDVKVLIEGINLLRKVRILVKSQFSPTSR